MDLTNFTRCNSCSTRAHVVMVHKNDLRSHRELDHLNSTPCCDAHPVGYEGESPCRFNEMARGVRH